MEDRRAVMWKMLGSKKGRIWIKMGFFKKFVCDKCDNKFSQQEELMNHQQIVHGKDLQYDCKECKQYFSNMEDMRTHLQRNHSYKKYR
jgi:KRAB domain-containing zinc finger protein